MNMNTKIYEKSPAVKRIFVSIREHPPVPLPKKAFQPKPPCQPGKFIRKKQDSSRCHTPDQGGGKPTPPVNVAKPTYRRSLSPFVQPKPPETVCTPYFKPKENESLISIVPPEKEDSLCLPYELNEPEKPVRKRALRTSVRALGRNIDLKKGNFSIKQATSDSSFTSKVNNENSRIFGNSIVQFFEESTTVASRTPSPVIPQRNSKCHALSKGFKINKQNFVTEVEKQNRAKSLEKENSESDVPWQSILRDLENVLQIKDLSPHQPSYDVPRIPVKITRV
jgi:hypothetical protein